MNRGAAANVFGLTSPGRTDRPAATDGARKLLLVASTGGHLAELLRLLPTLDASRDSLWVTFRTPQSEALLAGRRVHYVRYIRPRDFAGVWTVFWSALRIVRRERFDAAVSTGSGIALACFPAARLRGIPTHYIESIGRVQAPSTTGRVLAAVPGTHMSSQAGTWPGRRWSRHPSVLSAYRSLRVPLRHDRPRLFVTLGTIEGYRFDALIDAVLATGLADRDTVWQLGDSMRSDLPGTVYRQMSSDDFVQAACDADVVISHAGVGSLLVLLEAGKYPLLVTRRAARKEHVDDHQTQLAAMVNPLDVGRVIEVEQLSAELVRLAHRRAVVAGGDPVAVAG